MAFSGLQLPPFRRWLGWVPGWPNHLLRICLEPYRVHTSMRQVCSHRHGTTSKTRTAGLAGLREFGWPSVPWTAPSTVSFNGSKSADGCVSHRLHHQPLSSLFLDANSIRFPHLSPARRAKMWTCYRELISFEVADHILPRWLQTKGLQSLHVNLHRTSCVLLGTSEGLANEHARVCGFAASVHSHSKGWSHGFRLPVPTFRQ